MMGVRGTALRRMWVPFLLGIGIVGAEVREDSLGDPLPDGAIARLGTLRMRYGGVGDLAYLPDGRALIASGSSVEIWDVGAGQRVLQARPAGSSIRSLAIRPDGQAVLLADAGGGIHEWDPETDRILRQIATGVSGLVQAEYSPDAARVLVTRGTPPELREFDLATGEERVAIEGQMHNFRSGIYDATGETAFAGGSAGSGPVLAHYDLATGARLRAWHEDFISYGRSPRLSPDGQRILAGTRHMAIEFRIEDYAEQNRFRGHHGHAVPAVAYCRDPDQILTGSRDGSIRLWDRLENRVLLRWVAHSGHCRLLAVSPDGSRVLSFGGGMVVESDLATGEPTFQWQRHRQAVQAVAVLPGGQRVVSGSSDASLRIWDISSGRSLSVWDGAHLGAYAVAVAPDGNRLAAGCKDGVVREFSAEDGRLLRERTGHRGYVRSVAYTPDGRHLISSAGDGRIRVWEAENDHASTILKEHRGGVLDVAVSADGQRLLSGGRDGTVRLWDLPAARLVRTFTGHRGWVEAVRFAAGGDRAFSAGRDGRILEWDLERGEIRSERVHGGWVRALAISPDGTTLCAGGEDNRISCWNLETGQRDGVLRGHASHVLDLAFTPDGRQIVSASDDTTLLVWEVPGRER